MFCKWCGKNIDKIGIPCPYCGKEQGSLENGNGFWDLCESKPDVNQSQTHQTMKSAGLTTQQGKKNPNATANSDKSHKLHLSLVSVVACIIACVALVGVFVCLGKISADQKKISSLNETISELQEINTSDEELLENLTEQMDKSNRADSGVSEK